MEQGTMQMHTLQDPERYGMSKAEQTQVLVNQVYYPPPGTANAYGYNGMPMAEVAQPPPNMYSYAGMPMAEAALAPPPIAQVPRSSGWCTCCCGPCARWSRKRWVILILIVAVIAFVLVVALILTVAVQNGKNGQGYGG